MTRTVLIKKYNGSKLGRAIGRPYKEQGFYTSAINESRHSWRYTQWIVFTKNPLDDVYNGMLFCTTRIIREYKSYLL